MLLNCIIVYHLTTLTAILRGGGSQPHSQVRKLKLRAGVGLPLPLGHPASLYSQAPGRQLGYIHRCARPILDIYGGCKLADKLRYVQKRIVIQGRIVFL